MDPRPSLSWHRVLRHYRSALAAIPVCAALIPVSIVAVCQWRAVREAEAHGALVRDLIDRGVTVPDADRLAQGPADRSRDPDSSAYYRSQHVALEEQLKRDLAVRGLSADAIAGILRATSALQPVSGRYTYESHCRARQEADLIRQLLQQGRTARDIEGVLRSGSGAAAEAKRADVEDAVRTLRRSGMSPEEVSRALRPGEATQTTPAPMPLEP
jgi:hypothetical protein